MTQLHFTSFEEFRARLSDVEYWWPYLAAVLKKHELLDGRLEPAAGFNPTYPTFLYGDVVVKLFGVVSGWRGSYASEHAAHALLTTDPEIAAPKLVASGHLFADEEAPWPYLITTRMSGISWHDAELTSEQRCALTADFGRQIERIHALPTAGITTFADLPQLDVTAALEQSSLPSHLIAQADDFLARLGPCDDVFLHSDLAGMHVFVEDGRLSGIIDWGDAMVMDRHYEIIQPHRDMFDCDKHLLKVFLEGADWPVDDGFADKALAFALHRQAIGLYQHQRMDVFEPVAAKFPLGDIATLDELAAELFAV